VTGWVGYSSKINHALSSCGWQELPNEVSRFQFYGWAMSTLIRSAHSWQNASIWNPRFLRRAGNPMYYRSGLRVASTATCKYEGLCRRRDQAMASGLACAVTRISSEIPCLRRNVVRVDDIESCAEGIVIFLLAQVAKNDFVSRTSFPWKKWLRL